MKPISCCIYFCTWTWIYQCHYSCLILFLSRTNYLSCPQRKHWLHGPLSLIEQNALATLSSGWVRLNMKMTTHLRLFLSEECVNQYLHSLIRLCSVLCRASSFYFAEFGRSCDRPSRHRFFLVSLCLKANAETVPKI